MRREGRHREPFAGKGRVLADSIRADGGEAEAFSADVTDAQSVAQACEAVRAVYGPCEFLVNGAGGNHPSATADEERFSRETPADPPKKGFFDLDPAGFSYVYGLNMTGAFLTTKFFARDMAERGRGAIVNIASVSGVLPLTKAPAYSSAKAAVANFTQWLAVYLGGSGVRVNAIAPGFFPRSRTGRSSGTRTARPRRAPGRSWRARRWGVSGGRRSWSARCSGSWTTGAPAS